VEEYLILYLDLLGFSSAITRSDEAAFDLILQLLQNLKSAESDPVSETAKVDDRTTRYTMTPGVSAFSDHIVLSSPWEAVKRVGPSLAIFLFR
jgi:hypothetical protein